MSTRWPFVVGVAFVVASLASCNSGTVPQSVVVYSSVDEVFARPIAEKFQQDTGIQVQLVPDTEETKSTGLVNRLIAEKDRPQADVFWSGDPVRAALLKAKGISTPYQSAQAAGLPSHVSDPERHWTGFSTRARVLIYNRNLVRQGQEPQSVLDLVDVRFKGKASMANPLFGTTSMHAAALFAALGEEKAKQFFEGFLMNGGTILSSNGEVRRRVASGEFALGLTDTDDANVARLEGQPIGIVYPDHDGMGTLLVPNCTVLIAKGPNPDAGKRFIDYLLQPDTEKALAQSEAAQIPLRAGVPTPPGMVQLSEIKPMTVDYAKLSMLLDRLSSGYLKDWVDRGQR
jgi:iron(III) transport system substrate-binding protein